MKLPFEAPQRRPRIEIVPLIDVMFFLLATFLMVSLSMVKNQGITVNLPRASTGQSQSTPRILTVTVTKNGVVFLDKQRMAFDGLRERLTKLHEKDSGLQVILNGDESASFGDVIKALDEIRKLGIERVSMRTTVVPQR